MEKGLKDDATKRMNDHAASIGSPYRIVTSSGIKPVEQQPTRNKTIKEQTIKEQTTTEQTITEQISKGKCSKCDSDATHLCSFLTNEKILCDKHVKDFKTKNGQLPKDMWFYKPL